jgi:hypothetical protein
MKYQDNILEAESSPHQKIGPACTLNFNFLVFRTVHSIHFIPKAKDTMEVPQTTKEKTVQSYSSALVQRNGLMLKGCHKNI